MSYKPQLLAGFLVGLLICLCHQPCYSNKDGIVKASKTGAKDVATLKEVGQAKSFAEAATAGAKDVAFEVAKDVIPGAAQLSALQELRQDLGQAKSPTEKAVAGVINAADYAVGEVVGPIGPKSLFEAGQNLQKANQTLSQKAPEAAQTADLPLKLRLGGSSRAAGVLAPSGRLVSQDKASDATRMATMVGTQAAASGALWGAGTQGAKDAAKGAAVDALTGGGTMGAAAATGFIAGATKGAFSGGAEGFAQGTEQGMETAQKGLIDQSSLRQETTTLEALFKARSRLKDKIEKLKTEQGKKWQSKFNAAKKALQQTTNQLELSEDQQASLESYEAMRERARAAQDWARWIYGSPETTPAPTSSTEPSWLRPDPAPPAPSRTQDQELDFKSPPSLKTPAENLMTPTAGRRKRRNH